MLLGRSCIAGFPSLRSHYGTVSGELCAAAVNIFGRPSEKDSVLVCLDVNASQHAAHASAGGAAMPDPEGGACRGVVDPKHARGGVLDARVAAEVLGARCFVNWPFLLEAEVVSVQDRGSKFSMARDGSGKVQQRKLTGTEASVRQQKCAGFLTLQVPPRPDPSAPPPPLQLTCGCGRQTD